MLRLVSDQSVWFFFQQLLFCLHLQKLLLQSWSREKLAGTSASPAQAQQIRRSNFFIFKKRTLHMSSFMWMVFIPDSPSKKDIPTLSWILRSRPQCTCSTWEWNTMVFTPAKFPTWTNIHQYHKNLWTLKSLVRGKHLSNLNGLFVQSHGGKDAVMLERPVNRDWLHLSRLFGYINWFKYFSVSTFLVVFKNLVPFSYQTHKASNIKLLLIDFGVSVLASLGYWKAYLVHQLP